MKRKDVKVVDPQQETPVEVTAKAIVDIQASAKALLASPLTREALHVLIHHNMPASRRVSMRVIGDVLDAAAGLGAFIKEGT